MNDQDWVILKTVAEEKNLTNAAEQLFITQPALTYRLKNMEKEFGASLFIRTPKGVILTPQGECLHEYAKAMLLELRRTQEQIDSMNRSIRGKLHLGISLNFAKHRLSRILKSFTELYPDVELSIITGLSGRINQLLQAEEISVAIVRGDYSWSEARHLISEEPVQLLAHHEIDLEQLPELPSIVYQTDGLLQKEIADWWGDQFSCPPRIAMQINDAETCRQLVALGLGWSVLPSMSCDDNSYDGLYTCPLFKRNGLPLTRRTWLTYRYSSVEFLPVRAFVEHLIAMERLDQNQSGKTEAASDTDKKQT